MVKDGWWNGAQKLLQRLKYIGQGEGTPQLIWESDLPTKSTRKKVIKIRNQERKGKGSAAAS